MSSFRAAALAVLAALVSPAQTITPEPAEYELRHGTPGRHTIPLRADQFAAIEVRQTSVAAFARVLDPDGKEVGGGGTPLPRMPYGVGIAAERAGDYVVEILAATPGASGRYSIRLLEITTRAQAAQPAPLYDRFLSPTIRALRPDKLPEFWNDVKRRGSPLVEPIEGDPQHVYVTFLFRHTPGTEDVMVQLFPLSLVDRDAWRLKRFGDTDLWYRTMRLARDARFQYLLVRNPLPATGVYQSPLGEARSILRDPPMADPLNPRKYGEASLLELPEAPPQPWIAVRPEVPKSKVERFPMPSKHLGNERNIDVYTPAAPARNMEVLIVMDGPAYLNLVPTPVILDNLIHEKKIPPTVAVFVPNVSTETRYRELGCSKEFAEFLHSELLPWVRSKYAVSPDAAKVTIAGSSRAGLMALCAGLAHPESIGKVISQSGIVWYDPSMNFFQDEPAKFKTDLREQPNWPARQFLKRKKLPLRFHLDAGTFEANIADMGNRSILESNRHLRDVLLAKGYSVHYQEFTGGHDYLNWRGTLADALIALSAP